MESPSYHYLAVAVRGKSWSRNLRMEKARRRVSYLSAAKCDPLL